MRAKETKRPLRPSAPMDPATRFVRSLDGEYFMVREAAEALGVTDRTLRNFLQGKVGDNPEGLGPSYKVNFGKVMIYLYTRDDIEKIRRYLEMRKQVLPNDGTVRATQGRPAKWTTEERLARQRLYSSQHYWRRRVGELEKVGDKKGAKAARDRVRKIQTQLKEIDSGRQSA